MRKVEQNLHSYVNYLQLPEPQLPSFSTAKEL